MTPPILRKIKGLAELEESLKRARGSCEIISKLPVGNRNRVEEKIYAWHLLSIDYQLSKARAAYMEMRDNLVRLPLPFDFDSLWKLTLVFQMK